MVPKLAWYDCWMHKHISLCFWLLLLSKGRPPRCTRFIVWTGLYLPFILQSYVVLRAKKNCLRKQRKLNLCAHAVFILNNKKLSKIFVSLTKLLTVQPPQESKMLEKTDENADNATNSSSSQLACCFRSENKTARNILCKFNYALMSSFGTVRIKNLSKISFVSASSLQSAPLNMRITYSMLLIGTPMEAWALR